MTRIVFRIGVSFVIVFASVAVASEPLAKSQQREAIAKIASLYLESIEGYLPGDIITESQVEELQHYLRVSHGVSPVTHRGLLHRALKDTAPLSRFFYREKGSEILRAAERKLGGYAEIEAISLRSQGRDAIQRAIAEQSAAEIVSFVEASRQSSADELDNEKKKALAHSPSDFLYAR